MKRFHTSLLLIALASLLAPPARGQQITNKKERDRIVKTMRELLLTAGLPGVTHVECGFRSAQLQALYDSVWRASDSVPIPPLGDIPINFDTDQAPAIAQDAVPLPPYVEGMDVLSQRVISYNAYLNGVLAFWLHFEEMLMGSDKKAYKLRRDGEGYRLDISTPEETTHLAMTDDYRIRSIKVVRSGKQRITVLPAFTRDADGIRLDSVAFNATTEDGDGSMAIGYTYGKVDGTRVMTSAAVKGAGIIPIMTGGDDMLIDETFTFTNYKLDR